MNPLSGNPFAEYHQHRPGVTEDDGQWAIAQAALALAFEQRTANLIALYSCDDWQNKMTREKWEQVAGQIEARLGLNGDN